MRSPVGLTELPSRLHTDLDRSVEGYQTGRIIRGRLELGHLLQLPDPLQAKGYGRGRPEPYCTRIEMEEAKSEVACGSLHLKGQARASEIKPTVEPPLARNFPEI